MTELLQQNLPAMVEWVRDISPQLWAMARQKVMVCAIMEIVIPILISIGIVIVAIVSWKKTDVIDLAAGIIITIIFLLVLSFAIGGIGKLLTIDYQTLLSLRYLLTP